MNRRRPMDWLDIAAACRRGLLLTVCAVGLSPAAAWAQAGPVLNELQASTTGTDWEFFELSGAPGTSLAGLTLISIESDVGAATGRIDAVVPLSGAIPADGFWWAGSPTGEATYGGTCGQADASFPDNTFENGSTTNLLVRGFSGAVGLDLDANDDGVLDVMPWTELVDGVALQDTVTDFAYAGVTALGPDGAFLPSGVERLPDAGPWSGVFLNFNTPDGTPGASNVTGCQPGGPPAVSLNEVQASTTGTDWEFFELTGDPGTSLAGLTLISIESDVGAATGQIDAVVPLSGAIPADGFWWAGSPTGEATYGGTCGQADASFPDNTFENGSTTNLLVRGFSGAVGLDLDTNDDGVLDVMPWTELVDGVALQDTVTDFAYAGVTALGPDGAFLPSGVERLPDAGPWSGVFLNFSTPDGTPGASNVTGCQLVVPDAFIHDVQGSAGQVAITTPVRIQAIVVGDFQESDQLSGFFVQEEDADADADPATSEGIFVYCASCPTAVAVGDLVQVTGTPGEFFGMSQVTATQASSVQVIGSGNVLPTPAVIDLPAGGSTRDAATFEAVEGMLITFADPLYVSEYFELARYGQLILTSDARPTQFTDANEPDATAYAAFLADLNSRRIILDDDNNIQNDAITGSSDEPYFWPRPGLSNSNLLRGGDRITGLTGVMHWSFAGQSGTDAWRVRPVDGFAYSFEQQNPRPAVPGSLGGSLRVASFNVLNYFTTINSRGADSSDELDRQRAKTASAICAMDADIVGLIEIENNGSVALADLLGGMYGVNQSCGPYDFVSTGAIGTDQIAVAFIYRPATVDLEGRPAILTSSVDPRFVDTLNRPALAQTFSERASGGKLTVVVNHFKSKGSPCDAAGDPDVGDGQGNCNLTRTAAAAALVDWLAADPTGSGDPDFLIVGDLNAYRMEDPIAAVKSGADDTAGTADDFTDLLDSLVGPDAYTYLFDGQLGYLDHALASGSLLPQVTGVAEWHINADEIPVFDYNDDVLDGTNEQPFERESTSLPIYEPNAYRSSDHDPVIVALEFDSDGDGVLDGSDQCPGTVIPEGVPTIELRGKRWALADYDLVFDTAVADDESYTISDTRGCSCEQIIAETGIGEGHLKFGCSDGVMKSWIEGRR